MGVLYLNKFHLSLRVSTRLKVRKSLLFSGKNSSKSADQSPTPLPPHYFLLHGPKQRLTKKVQPIKPLYLVLIAMTNIFIEQHTLLDSQYNTQNRNKLKLVVPTSLLSSILKSKVTPTDPRPLVDPLVITGTQDTGHRTQDIFLKRNILRIKPVIKVNLKFCMAQNNHSWNQFPCKMTLQIVMLSIF